MNTPGSDTEETPEVEPLMDLAGTWIVPRDEDVPIYSLDQPVFSGENCRVVDTQVYWEDGTPVSCLEWHEIESCDTFLHFSEAGLVYWQCRFVATDCDGTHGSMKIDKELGAWSFEGSEEDHDLYQVVQWAWRSYPLNSTTVSIEVDFTDAATHQFSLSLVTAP